MEFILAENFAGLGMFLMAMLVGLPVLSLLSFISSYRGRFPILAIPPMLISLPLIFGCLIARELVALGFAALFSVPLVLGASSIYVWSERRRSK